MLKRYLLLIFFLWCSAGFVVAQVDLVDEVSDVQWSVGSVMLKNGEELKGSLSFNDNNGVLSYQNGDESRSFTPRSVAGFEFFDRVADKQRIFYAMDYDDPKLKPTRTFFFELIMDLKDFAVISRIDPVNIKERQASPAGYGVGAVTITAGGGTITEIRQTETIFFLSPQGKIEPYIRVINKAVDRPVYDSKKKKKETIDSGVPQRYFSAKDYTMLKKYAKDNKLDFEIKEDLLQILDFFSKNRETN